jgi:hypothetical protein
MPPARQHPRPLTRQKNSKGRSSMENGPLRVLRGHASAIIGGPQFVMPALEVAAQLSIEQPGPGSDLQ